jgi:alpha-beta hydrolase superfamily lysophospholipase
VRLFLRWAWSRRLRVILVSLLLAFLTLNVLAYMHARALTHFESSGLRTVQPEALSFWQKAGILATGVSVPRPENQVDPGSVRLPFTTYRIEAEDGIALETWYIPRHDAMALVLMFHGYAACKAGLLPEAKAFYELGYSVLLVDFRGSGGSSGSETTLGIREADDMARVCQFVQSTWTQVPIILYGQSMGSVAVLRALAMHEDIQPAAVVLECPFDRLRTTVASRFTAMGLPAFPAADLLLFWGSVQMGFNGFRHNPEEYARAVRSPVLQMHRAKDTRVTQEHAEAIFRNLGGEKEFQVFDAVGHESYFAKRPEVWKKTVSTFLARHR